MQQLVLSVLLLVANVFGVAMSLPQAVRLHRTRSAQGVSVVWIGVSLAMNGWWAAYAIVSQLWGLLPVSIGAAVLYLVMTGQILRLVGTSAVPRLLVGLLLLGMAPMPFLLSGGMEAAGLVTGLCYGGQFMPAVAASLRSDDLLGLSTATWWMALVEAVVWVIYGLTVSDTALLVGGSGGAVASAMIVFRLAFVRRPRLSLRA